MLYDEADNLLESRMLKADEVVSSGESLTFQAYLVDVGDPKDGSKPSFGQKVQPSDQGCVRKPFAALRPNFKTSSLHCVFRKRELHKYGAVSPDNVKPTTTTGLMFSFPFLESFLQLSIGEQNVEPFHSLTLGFS
uniref:Uncharacterized protein n=1 Tax=Noccaea caerulescens TaxID=107243 RepID=A0A1J3E4Q4_NOCCA